MEAEQTTCYEQLQIKIEEEFEAYKKWLLQQPAEEILNHTYEYTIKQDILAIFNDCLDEESFDEENAKALLNSTNPLKEVFELFRSIENNHMENIKNAVYQCAYLLKSINNV